MDGIIPRFLKNLVCLVGFFPVVSNASFEPKTTGARMMGLGNAFVAFSGDAQGVLINPAGWGVIDKLSVGMFYTRPYGISELTLVHGVCTIPTSLGTFGGSIASYGYEKYHENTLTVTYAARFFDDLNFGLNLKTLFLEIQNYGRDQALALDIGIQSTILNHLSWGFSAINLNAPAFGSSKPDRVAQIFITGFLYHGNENILILADLVKDVRFPVNLKFGFEYTPVPSIAFRVGWNSDPSLISAGVGFQFSRFRLDYGFSDHQVLGASHSLSVLFGFPSKKNGEKKRN